MIQFYNTYDVAQDYSIFALIPIYFALIWLISRVFGRGGRDDD